MSLAREAFGFKWLAMHARWLHRSSTLRLTLILSALFGVGMALTVFITLSFGHSALIERADQTLDSLASSIETIDAIEGFEGNAAALVQPLDEIRALPRPFMRVLKNGPVTIFLDDDFRGFEHWRTMVMQDDEGEAYLIAVPLDDAEDALELLSNILWTTTMIVVGFALILGLGFGFWARRRLVRINKALHQLAGGDLKARTGLSKSSDDLDDLAQQVDVTASELERLVAQTRHLSASIAHDLRTPLARLRSQIEDLPDSDKRGAALEEANRLSQIFDTIMRVAKIEASQGHQGFEAVNLGHLAEDVAETFGPVVEDSGKQLSVDISHAQTVEADRQMLIQALANLIQNAIVHGGQEIRLIVRGNELELVDNGVGVEPGQYSEITKPMVRLDEARKTDGSGLGLALVKAVAERHGAALSFYQNEPSGLGVRLKLTKL